MTAGSPSALISPPPRAVVFIGPPKTASTHVQELLAGNQDTLRTLGWTWPRGLWGSRANAKSFANLATALSGQGCSPHYRVKAAHYLSMMSMCRGPVFVNASSVVSFFATEFERVRASSAPNLVFSAEGTFPLHPVLNAMCQVQCLLIELLWFDSCLMRVRPCLLRRCLRCAPHRQGGTASFASGVRVSAIGHRIPDSTGAIVALALHGGDQRGHVLAIDHRCIRSKVTHRAQEEFESVIALLPSFASAASDTSTQVPSAQLLWLADVSARWWAASSAAAAFVLDECRPSHGEFQGRRLPGLRDGPEPAHVRAS